MAAEPDEAGSIRAILFDLDGVLRHFDPEHADEVEQTFGLTTGVLITTAFDPELMAPMVTGRLSRADWMAEVGRRVGNVEAANTWLSKPAEVDRAMLALADQLRHLGYQIAILTNGTDAVPAELVNLGIATHIDRLFNTAEIGVAKPNPDVFHHCCTDLGLAPNQVFFTDDSAGNVEAATEVGLVAHHFTGIEQLRAALEAALGRSLPPLPQG